MFGFIRVKCDNLIDFLKGNMIRRKNIKRKLIAHNNENDIIVSLTTYKARLSTIDIVLKSLLNQKLMPNRIILILGTDVKDVDIPESLKMLEQYGIEIIKNYQDLKPHKKYLYTMQKYPNNLIITVDDDVIYDKNLIYDLYNSHKLNPKCVVARRAHRITLDDNSIVKKYKDWDFCHISVTPDNTLCPTGVGGILYPPNCLFYDWNNIEKIEKICLMQDDLWLKYMELLAGTEVVTTSKRVKIHYIYGTQKNTLTKINIGDDKNDETIKKLEKNYVIDIIGREIKK